MSGLRLLGDAAQAVDARSSRSRQRKIGPSDIGTCRRRAGYSHHGVAMSNPENATGIAAIVGTWIHKGALDTMKREWGALIETRLEDDVLRGHADAIELPNDWRVRAGLPERDDAPDTIVVDDLKTKRDGSLVDMVRNRGPKRSELFQVHLYGDLLRRGKVKPIQGQKHLAGIEFPVETVRLRYFPRTGDNAEYVHEIPFDESIATEALDWVGQVAASKAPEELPRDQDGPGLATACDYCPWRRECWGEESEVAVQTSLLVTDADLWQVMREYDEARAVAKDQEEAKQRARLILDGTRPAVYADGEGHSYRLSWSGGRMLDPKPNVDAMLTLFREAGIPVPYLEPRPSGRTIHLTRWDAPPDPVCGKPVGDPVPYRKAAGDTWLQDRQRGGWTCYRVWSDENGGSHVQNEHTAGEFAKRFPDYVEPRTACVLKRGHSGDCEETTVALDTETEVTLEPPHGTA